MRDHKLKYSTFALKQKLPSLYITTLHFQIKVSFLFFFHYVCPSISPYSSCSYLSLEFPESPKVSRKKWNQFPPSVTKVWSPSCSLNRVSSSVWDGVWVVMRSRCKWKRGKDWRTSKLGRGSCKCTWQIDILLDIKYSILTSGNKVVMVTNAKIRLSRIFLNCEVQTH